jgi:hypothetical protein
LLLSLIIAIETLGIDTSICRLGTLGKD